MTNSPTVSASTGQVLSGAGQPYTVGQNDPYAIFSKNLTTMLTNAQKIGAQGRQDLQGQIGGLQREQASLGNTSGPLAFLYNMESPGAVGASSQMMGGTFQPGITSIQGQEDVAQKNLQDVGTNIAAEQAQIQTQAALKNAGIGRYSNGVFPNNQPYSYDSVTGQYTDQFGSQITAPTGTKPPTPHPLGNGVDWSSYNGSMDPDYEKKMDNSIAYIQKALPQGLDTVGQDGLPVIDNFLKSNRATFTSAMISLAASQYGVDPINLLASVQHESVWGTSNIAKTDNNFGGIKWIGQTNATMGSSTGEGDHYAHFNSPQDGLYEQAKLIAGYTPGNKTNTLPPTAPIYSSNPDINTKIDMVKNGQQSATNAWNDLNTQYGKYGSGGQVANEFLATASKVIPGFSQVVSDSYATNLTLAQTIVKPSQNAANKIIGTYDSTTGKGSVGGVFDLYDKLVTSSKTNARYQTGILGGLFGGTGYGQKEQQAFNAAITDINNNVLNVLGAGSSGVAANNQTSDLLFPKDAAGNYTMDKPTLLQKIGQIQGFMSARFEGLTTNPFDNNSPVQTTPISTTSKTPSTGNDYASYLKAIGLIQ